MDAVIQKIYMAQRKLGWGAKWALNNARTLVDWDNLNGWIEDAGSDCAPSAPWEGDVRITVLPDESGSNVLDFDMPDHVRKAEERRVDTDGVWGIVGQFWDGTEWIDADSVCGFIGNDWQGSGYDTDIMRSTIDAYRRHGLTLN